MPFHRLGLLAVLAAVSPTTVSAQGACGRVIAETRAIVESDVASGNLDAPVGERFRRDLDRAADLCAAGRDGQAMHLLGAAKARFGYH